MDLASAAHSIASLQHKILKIVPGIAQWSSNLQHVPKPRIAFIKLTTSVLLVFQTFLQDVHFTQVSLCTVRSSGKRKQVKWTGKSFSASLREIFLLMA